MGPSSSVCSLNTMPAVEPASSRASLALAVAERQAAAFPADPPSAIVVVRVRIADAGRQALAGRSISSEGGRPAIAAGVKATLPCPFRRT